MKPFDPPGVTCSLVTPFGDEGAVDATRLAPIVDRAVAAGVGALAVAGDAGECDALTETELLTYIADVARLVDGRLPLWVSIGGAPGLAREAARVALEVGAAALILRQPLFAHVSPRGLCDYIAVATEPAPDLPLLFHLRSDALGTAGIDTICRHSPVSGVIWATPQPIRLAAARDAAPSQIRWIAGLSETQAAPLYSAGAVGLVSTLANLWPARSVALQAALKRGDVRAAQLVEGVRAFETLRGEEGGGTGVSVVKAALAMAGIDCGAVRPPGSWPLGTAQSERLRGFMERNRLLAPAETGAAE